jgi:16S rRNA (cytosine1402-N4)-methyltransferase
MIYAHIPVMLNEALDFVRPKKGGRYIDCTLGGGGYTSALSKVAGNEGLVISFDLDKKAIDNFSGKNPGNVRLINDNFRNLTARVNEVAPNQLFDGIVMDLGLSSAQIDDPERGFSFKFDSSLDMSFSGNSAATQELVNRGSERELFKIISDYGEDKSARFIARAIVAKRLEGPIMTAKELADVIMGCLPERLKHGKIHPATKTFQALRMATNNELDSLKEVLPQALSLLSPGGRLVVVSFHSLEDRIVKDFFRQESKDCLCPPSFPACRCGHTKKLTIITKKPVLPSVEEIDKNARSRSAKLRAAEKI